MTITTADWRLAWFLAGDGNAPDLFVDQPFKSGVPNFIDNLSHDSAKRLPTDRRVVIALHTRNGMEECKQWLRIGLRERVAEYEK